MTRTCLALVLLAAGCATGPYGAYRAAHPDWDGAFPTASADLARTVAALYAPGSKWTTTVTQIYAWRIAPESWTSVDLENLPAAPADADYALVASLHCASNDGNAEFMRSEIVWYLLPRNRLAAWDHYAFEPGCAVTDEFQPARGPLAATERALLERAHIPLPATASGAAEYYDKGLAFLRAGRRDDADAMLAAGDRAGTGEFDIRARFSQPHAAGRESAAQARAALVGALGAAP